MKVKIKDKIYDANNEPIMIILSETDKQNIATMPKEYYKYCMFPDSISVEEIKKFMEG